VFFLPGSVPIIVGLSVHVAASTVAIQFSGGGVFFTHVDKQSPVKRQKRKSGASWHRSTLTSCKLAKL
jgi:hypothetical protein